MAALLFAPQFAAPATAATRAELRLHRMVNRVRASVGARPLRMREWLCRIARRHSRRMARQRRVFHHPCLPCAMSGRRWRYLGQNVGTGRSVRQVHRAFLGSSAHRANVLGRRYRKIGIGVVRTGRRRVWVTQIFVG